MEHPRGYYQKLVKAHGGTNKSSVVKNLSFLVCNENKSSSKSRKAEKYGTQIIDEVIFLSMAGELDKKSEPEVNPEPKIESINKTFKYENYSLFDDEE